MAAADILGQASAAFPIWDGRSVIPPVYRSANNQPGSTPPTLLRIINSYDGGTIASTEMSQALIIGPKPVAFTTGASPTTYACVFSALLMIDTSVGSAAVTVSMPPDPYPGMVVIVKDTGNNASGNNIIASVTGGPRIQQPGALGTYSVSGAVISTNGVCATWSWNPANTGPAPSGAWELIATVGY